jgi:hypothetical protein
LSKKNIYIIRSPHPITTSESATLKIGKTRKSAKSTTAPNLILSIRFPRPPLHIRASARGNVKWLPFVLKVRNIKIPTIKIIGNKVKNVV